MFSPCQHCSKQVLHGCKTTTAPISVDNKTTTAIFQYKSISNTDPFSSSTSTCKQYPQILSKQLHQQQNHE
ncbi:hypothetical protein AAHE18_11G257700 [Arachis hypogaea]